MKIFRFGPKGKERSGVIDCNGDMRNISSYIKDITPQSITSDEFKNLCNMDLNKFPLISETERLGSCLSKFQRFFCIGLNYIDHVVEVEMDVPQLPTVFMKVCEPTGPNDGIILPNSSLKTDWEVELGVVIKNEIYNVSPDQALENVAGYCVVNDVSERDFQLEHGGQWIKGKSCESFGPVGPYLVTPDEISDPQSLILYLDVNGTNMQSGRTSNMVFTVSEIISHLSFYFKLLPGDIIATGTPSGVGMGKSPKRFLKEGDIIELGISGLGKQSHIVTRQKPLHSH